MDGVADGDDNCPADPNPNQLDFDDNGLGNVCDTLVFTDVSGFVTTNLAMKTEFAGACLVQMDLVVTSGTVRVQLDDHASIASFEISELGFADANVACQLAINVDVTLENLLMSYAGNPFPVDVAHSQADHSAGAIDGMSSGPHSTELATTMNLDAGFGANPPQGLQQSSALPEFDVMVIGGGSNGSLSFSDQNFQMTTPEIYIVTNPFDLKVFYGFVGLDGDLSLAP